MERILTARWGEPSPVGLDRYVETGGYRGLEKVVREMTPSQVVEMVKASGLRGRGGAGFPAGVKWGFVPRDRYPHYLVVNFDEGEPGTFKDRELVERDPHLVVEGIAIAAYAIEARQAFVYVRGEFLEPGWVLQRALEEAREAGYLGPRVMGTDFSLEVVVHRGAGAYVCGEETALLESLEGRRGQPRMRPPFPATHGLYNQPTVVQNVETLANLHFIAVRGPDWYASIGPPKSPGPKIFCVSGEVERPGNYEAPMGTPARTLIEECAGGVLGGRRLKAFTPGGSSTPLLPASLVDTPMDFESVAAAGSMLGTGAMIVLSDATCVVGAVRRWVEFYVHESCGKCTPCREGNPWMAQIFRRLEEGEGRKEDLPLLESITAGMFGRCFCAFGDGAVSPVVSSLRHFREEFEEHVALGGCPLRVGTGRRA